MKARPISRTVISVIFFVGIAAAAGYLIGARRDTVSVRSAMVYSAGSISTAPVEGWTYGIPLDVPWTDASGSFHQNGRPDCLPPGTALIGPITFGTVDVRGANMSWRQVVWVSCGGASR